MYKYLLGLKIDVKSRNWLVAVLLLFLLANNVHLYEVYSLITGHSGFHVVLILIVLDLSILTFAAYGKRFAAFMFSSVVFATTVTYFFHGPSIKDSPFDHWGFAIIGVLFSFVFATGVYVFTEIFVQKDYQDRMDKRDEMLKEQKRQEDLEKEKRRYEASKKLRSNMSSKIKILSEEVRELERKLKFTPKSKRDMSQKTIDQKKDELSSLEEKFEIESQKEFTL